MAPITGTANKEAVLNPGEYDAETCLGGIITVCYGGEIYKPMPGQFVFLSAPKALTDYFRASVALVKAEAEYDAARERWEKSFTP
jgi:hypothetical protein